MQTLRIERFDGGLNNRTAEANLPANMSASLWNVDILDTGGITRRNGYQVQGTFSDGDEGKALFRYYKANGARYWVGVCGTQLSYSVAAATHIPETYIQAEDVNTGGTEYDWAEFSGGRAVSVVGTETVTFAVPYSTEIKTKFRGNWTTGSIKIDSGSWSNISVSSLWHTSSGLSATSHTVRVKNGGSNNQSLKWALSGVKSILTWTDSFDGGGSIQVVVKGASGTKVTLYADHEHTSDHTSATLLTGSWQSLTLTTTPGRIQSIRLTATQTLYVDNLYYSGSTKWYGQTATGWSADNGTLSISTSEYSTLTVRLCVDVLRYSAIVNPTVATNVASEDRHAFAQYEDVVYYGNSTNGIDKFNGSTTTHVNGTVKPDFLCVHKERVFSARDYILEYTSAGSPEDWTNGGAINIAASDSGVFCTGLKVLRDSLLWYGANELHAVDVQGDELNWQHRTISRVYGCVAPRTLVDAGDSHIFLSADGVKGYGLIEGIYSDDGSGVVPLSKFLSLNVYNPEKACGAFYKGRYWLSVDEDGNGNDRIYVCDMDKRIEIGGVHQPPWTRYDIPGVTAFCRTEMISSDDHGLYCLTSDGVLWRLDHGTDDGGSDITMTYVHPPIAVKGFSRVTHFRHAHVAAESSVAQSATFTPSTDDVNGQAFTAVFDTSTGVQPVRSPIQARGRYIQSTLSAGGAAQPLTVHSIEYTYLPPRLR